MYVYIYILIFKNKIILSALLVCVVCTCTVPYNLFVTTKTNNVTNVGAK